MRIAEIIWDGDSLAHIARHGVEPSEAEEACFSGKPYILKARHNRYIVLSQTKSGRYLALILICVGQGKAKVITARAMSEAERKLYKRR